MDSAQRLFTQHRHPAEDTSTRIFKQASRKPQKHQEGPVRSLVIKTDSQSLTGGVIWSMTAKGVGLSETVQKGVTTSLDTWQQQHDTECRPVVAGQHLTSSSRGLPVHRPPPQFCPARTSRAPCNFCVCSTRAGALRIPVQTLIRSRIPAKPGVITQTLHYDTTRNNCTTD